MANRLHLTPEGEPRPCVAEFQCRYGDAPHYDTYEEARAAYEATQESFASSNLHKLSQLASKMRKRGHKIAKANRKALSIGLATAALVGLGACAPQAPLTEDHTRIVDTTSQVVDQEAPPVSEEAPAPSEDRDYWPEQEDIDSLVDRAEDFMDSPQMQDLREELDSLLDDVQIPDGLSDSGAQDGADYDRDAFKHWTDTSLYANTCDTRQDILQRDMTNIVYDTDGCTVLSGTLADPYTGETIYYERGNNTVDIDHIYSLSMAWERGADGWSDAQREAFANDAENLLAVDASSNRSKGAQGPGTWMPTNREYACEWGISFLEVSQKYDLSVSQAEVSSVEQACG